MRVVALAVLGWIGVAEGQATPGPEAPVITLANFCGPSNNGTGPCQTTITRSQLESLAEALQPGISPELRAKVAVTYARLLRMAAAAEERGLDKTAAFALEMQYARLQLLSQDLDRVLRQEAGQVSASDINDYYQKNLALFDRATVARIFIPAAAKAPNKTDMARLAAGLRERAARGEDPDTLQTAAYAAAGIPGTLPKTTLKDLGRSSLPPSHEVALNLAPGEVSEVITDPGGGHFVYKMLHRQTLTLEQATPQIRQALGDERYKAALQGFSAETKFDEAYFASRSSPASRGHHRRSEDSASR